MEKGLIERECGKGTCQRKDGLYYAAFVDKSGKRREKICAVRSEVRKGRRTICGRHENFLILADMSAGEGFNFLIKRPYWRFGSRYDALQSGFKREGKDPAICRKNDALVSFNGLSHYQTYNERGQIYWTCLNCRGDQVPYRRRTAGTYLYKLCDEAGVCRRQDGNGSMYNSMIDMVRQFEVCQKTRLYFCKNGAAHHSNAAKP